MDIKDWAIVLLGSALLVTGLWLRYEINNTKIKTKTVTETKVETRVDTVHAPDTSRTLEPEIPEPDTVYEDTTNEHSELKLRSYTTSVSDSLIDAKINTVVRGYLVDQNLTYTPQYPLKIRINTNTTVTERITKTVHTRIRISEPPKSGQTFTIMLKWALGSSGKPSFIILSASVRE